MVHFIQILQLLHIIKFDCIHLHNLIILSRKVNFNNQIVYLVQYKMHFILFIIKILTLNSLFHKFIIMLKYIKIEINLIMVEPKDNLFK